MDRAQEDIQRTEQRAVGEREVRWSARRKEGVVMRLLRGESLDLLARESAQPAGLISAWREEFLAAGREGLKARPLPVEDFALREAQRNVGGALDGTGHRQGAVGAQGPPSVAEALSVSEPAARTTFSGVQGGGRVPLGGV